MKPPMIVALLCIWSTALFWLPQLRDGWTGFVGNVFCLGLIYIWAKQPAQADRGTVDAREEHGRMD
jgi:hypothetical protein